MHIIFTMFLYTFTARFCLLLLSIAAFRCATTTTPYMSEEQKREGNIKQQEQCMAFELVYFVYSFIFVINLKLRTPHINNKIVLNFQQNGFSFFLLFTRNNFRSFASSFYSNRIAAFMPQKFKVLMEL